jgi:hypothetical protein
LANVSKISTIIKHENEEEEDGEEILATPIKSNSKEDNKAEVESSEASNEVELEEECHEFKRNEPNTRLSKNLKQMFKNVINYQIDALNNLEKFYEAQLDKLEQDRQMQLKQAQQQLKQPQEINEYFDKQRKMLEERVQINLNQIWQSKKQPQILQQQSLNQTTKCHELTQKLSQFIILKQLQQQQQKQQTTTSKCLIDMKSNKQFILLPNKDAATAVVASSFKRNLSLPFKQNMKLSELTTTNNQKKSSSMQQEVTTSSPLGPNLNKIQQQFKNDNSTILACNSTCNTTTASTNMTFMTCKKWQNKSLVSLRSMSDTADSTLTFFASQQQQQLAVASRGPSLHQLNNNFETTTMTTHHPNKYNQNIAHTRLSDCHLQFRLRKAAANNSNNNNAKLTFETQV